MLRRMNRLASCSVARPRLGGAAIGVVLWCLTAVARADVVTGVDAEAGLPFWELRDAGISLRLVQRQPDQTRAFFMARGFSREAVEHIAQRCVFQTVFKNVSAGALTATIEYDLREWTVRSADGDARLLTREYWAERWTKLDIAKPARIAFEWALFPTRQIYHPGDYNWGMSVVDLPPGSSFDVAVTWRQDGKPHSARIAGVRCAPDGPDNADDPDDPDARNETDKEKPQ